MSVSNDINRPLVRTIIVGLITIFSLAAAQENVAGQLYRHTAPDGTVTFSDAPMRKGRIVRSNYRGDYGRPTATASCKGFTTRQLDARGETFRALITEAAQRHSLEPNLLMAMARVESCFDPKARSRVGAEGMLQLMPPTARSLGVLNSFDVKANLDGGARYLSSMLKRYNGDTHLALAAYNAGPGTVKRYGGVPPYPETQKYIKRLTRHYDRYKQTHGS